MTDDTGFTSIISNLQENATVESVYGDPIESNGKIIIPVAKIRYGFGGGYGSESDHEDQTTENQESTGAGMGAGVAATPSGVVEITDSETRFISIGSNRKLAAVAIVCLGRLRT